MSKIAANKEKISLKGSAKLIVEFFECGINSIFYQRNLYPPEDFSMTQKYGLNFLITNDHRISIYLKKVLTQIESWLQEGQIKKLVLAIISQDTRETLERWEFDVHVKDGKENVIATKEKSEKEVRQEIQAVIRQIVSSVTFLPIYDEARTFNILAYTDKDVEVPNDWGDSHPHLIKEAELVKLLPFSTNHHK
ncbi:8176_t:CDS:2, partial [Ambispora leptoticha]